MGQRLQGAGEVGAVAQLLHHAVDQPPAEAHPDPAAGLHRAGVLLRDGVVERPVQVRQGHVHDDPGHLHRSIVTAGADIPSGPVHGARP